jgi:hypothetical protein
VVVYRRTKDWVEADAASADLHLLLHADWKAMSIEIRASLICDNCGTRLDGPIQTKTCSWDNSYWDVKALAKKLHWLILPRYGKTKHLCQVCADGGVIQKLKQAAKEANK